MYTRGYVYLSSAHAVKAGELPAASAYCVLRQPRVAMNSKNLTPAEARNVFS